jgi:hypothetical protein
MNFQTILEELDRLYEEDQRKLNKKANVKEGIVGDLAGEAAGRALANALTEDEVEEGFISSAAGSFVGTTLGKALTEDDDDADEIEIEDDEAMDAEADEAAAEKPANDEPKQVILECSNCGGLVIKSDADVEVDEETDLANVEEACQYCEEAKGYKILGVVAPYEAAEEELEEGIFGKKDKQTYAAWVWTEEDGEEMAFGDLPKKDVEKGIKEIENELADQIKAGKAKVWMEPYDEEKAQKASDASGERTRQKQKAKADAEREAALANYTYDEWIQAVEIAHKAYEEGPEAGKINTRNKVMDFSGCKNLCDDVIAYMDAYMKEGPGKKLAHKSFAKHLKEGIFDKFKKKKNENLYAITVRMAGGKEKIVDAGLTREDAERKAADYDKKSNAKVIEVNDADWAQLVAKKAYVPSIAGKIEELRDYGLGSKLEEFLDADINLNLDGGRGNDVSVLGGGRQLEQYDEDGEELDEGIFGNKKDSPEYKNAMRKVESKVKEISGGKVPTEIGRTMARLYDSTITQLPGLISDDSKERVRIATRARDITKEILEGELKKSDSITRAVWVLKSGLEKIAPQVRDAEAYKELTAEYPKILNSLSKIEFTEKGMDKDLGKQINAGVLAVLSNVHRRGQSNPIKMFGAQ